ncbi:MAG: hypothetical protein HY785_20840 [Oscillatoriophycideae cyanobacterium NC_groundwater_1537_Pr4_S-0.65um_50_18]|nr:hypothetical protein [Oscillatoriophycideae cyanobacterium NC_groundwater_1537_Pr4_S-0.65um_50_18]
MATVKRRSSGPAAVSKSAIAQASTMLQTLPAKPRDNWSLREAITLLHDSILTALNRGYTHEEVSAMLGDQGVHIPASSLKRYLAAMKREKRADSKKAPKASARKTSASKAPVSKNLVSKNLVSKNLAQPTPHPQTAARKTPSSAGRSRKR